MPKLRLKRTPAEEAERAHRKAKKAQRREAKHTGKKCHNLHGGPSGTPVRDDHHRSKRRATNAGEGDNRDTSYESDDRFEWLEEQQRRKQEEEEFQQRVWDELGDQERLDNLTSNMNAYPHIPRRWKPSGTADLEGAVYNDPNLMDDEHYAEWVREGMWKKRDAQAYQEQLRKTAEEEARRKRAEQLASERARRESREADERRRRKRSRERRTRQEARDKYEARWDALLSADEANEQRLTFRDIPWPCYTAYSPSDGQELSLGDLTAESISDFLFNSTREPMEAAQKIKTIRETLLRFHPDKFEGRIISRVSQDEEGKVREGIGIVVRATNDLMMSSKR